MDSLISYESDNDNDFTEDVMAMPMSTLPSVKSDGEQDANYDIIGMDESDEDSNINGVIEFACHGDGSRVGGNLIEAPLSLADAPLDFRPNKYRNELSTTSLDRRHSIDMEMDDESNADDKSETEDHEYSDDELSDCEKSSESEQSISQNTEHIDGMKSSPKSPIPARVAETRGNIADRVAHDDDGSRRERCDSRRKENDRHLQTEESNCRRQKSWHRNSPPLRHEGGSKRSHSPDRNSRERSSHHRGSSRSPDRSWKNRRLDRRPLGAARPDGMTQKSAREIMGEQLKTQVQQVEAKTGITLPSYYNPAVMNPLRYAQQIQKRKLLWGNKANEAKAKDTALTATPWDATTFKGDNDGRMTEKFKRLMGIKTETSGTSAPPEGESKVMIQKQEEMFSNMEAQYQVARMVTHTHRGVGLGYGTYQTRPPLQRNS